jgi:hypothetical protein
LSLSEDFKENCSRYRFHKNGEWTLETRITTNASTIYHVYDFLGRTMVSQSASTGSSAQVTPFSQLDRESLEFMHAKLTELGGKPPALPEIETEKARPGLSKPRAA